jgi:hypothetical protein
MKQAGQYSFSGIMTARPPPSGHRHLRDKREITGSRDTAIKLRI